MKLKKVILTMIVMSIMNDNCYPLNIKAIKERPGAMTNLIRDLVEASRLAVPEFKSLEEAREFGKAHKTDDATIKEIFKLACQYKQMVMTFGLNNKFDNQWDNFRYYKAAWEVARGIEGARLADMTTVVAVGVGNGTNLPYLKEFLETKGFKNVVLEAIDDGWWIEDESLPKPDQDLRKEMVELADGVLIGRLESDEYRIRYVDIFDALPYEMLGKFDISFLTPGKKDMNISYIQESMRLLKETGILILRLRSGQEISRVDLVNFCEDNALTLSIYDESVFPNPDGEFQDLMIVIRRANFSSKANRSLNQELFNKLLGARLTEISV